MQTYSGISFLHMLSVLKAVYASYEISGLTLEVFTHFVMPVVPILSQSNPAAS